MARYTLRTIDTGRRTFWCPDSGGHVYEELPDRPGILGMQVCERLYHRGATLRATATTLAAVIRRERRRQRRWEASFLEPQELDAMRQAAR